MCFYGRISTRFSYVPDLWLVYCVHKNQMYDLRTKAGINPGVPSPKVSGEKACRISTPVYFRKRRRIQQMHHRSISIYNHGDRICKINKLCQSI